MKQPKPTMQDQQTIEQAAQALYEADLLKRPNYHDGTPRPTWEHLSPIAKLSWEVKQEV